MRLKIEYLKPEQLQPYANNAKLHPAAQVEQIENSIREFDFSDPIGIWGENEVVEGHGRLLAALKLGLKEVPVIRLDHLTDEQRKAYALAHNQTTMTSGWDAERILEEMGRIKIDMTQFGFDMSAFTSDDWFESRERNDTSREEGNDEYNEFLEKFETKKTTDDCYTPDVVYDAVAQWVCEEYKVQRKDFVRPFYPGGDYQAENYPEGCIVVDNPPFSILSEILKFYDERGIKFFLFAPTLTLFSSSSSSCALCCGVAVLYENGASVNTSFLTNLEDDRLRSCPELYQRVSAAVDEYRQEIRAELPKYDYPYEVVLSTAVAYLSKYGQDFRVGKADSVHIRQLDSQKEYDKALYGSGYLISERAAAERAAAKVWTLSERELEIIKSLGGES